MKRIFLTAVLICFCFVSVSVAGDAKLTQEQDLIIQIEQLQGTIDYAAKYIEAYTKAAKPFFAIRNQAVKDKKAAEDQLKALKKVGK